MRPGEGGAGRGFWVCGGGDGGPGRGFWVCGGGDGGPGRGGGPRGPGAGQPARAPQGARSLRPSEALAPLTTTEDECAEGLDRRSGEPCASAPVLRAVVAFAGAGGAPGAGAAGSTGAGPAAPTPAPGGGALPTAGRPGGALPTAGSREAAAVRAAAAELGCASESCVLTHPRFLKFAGETGALPQAGRAVKGDLDGRFKAKGPRHGRALLSNYNIDETLQRWARVFEGFFPCPFAMMDFETNGDFFGSVDLPAVLCGRVPADLGPGGGEVARRATCVGCVLYTDPSRGPGKHWVAVFVDCRPGCELPWTVEFFNSAGRPPDRPVVRWMERTRARLREWRAGLPGCQEAEVASVPVTDLGHQESQTECGLYALYYIRRRLEGAPYSVFEGRAVPDAAMEEFRQHLFRSH